MRYRFYRISEVCERLRIGRTKVYQLINSGELNTAKFGRCTCVTGDSLEELIAAALQKEGK